LADINARVKDFQPRGQPVVSVDTKPQALVGDLAHGGRASPPHGAPERVRGHAVVDPRVGNAMPDGVYEMTQHGGGGSGGGAHEPAALALATVRPWWQRMGCRLSPTAQHVLMTADGGGSHGSRARLWTVAWQKFRDTTGLAVSVGHVPPGTRQWHTIAQRVLCHSTQNWRGRPLVSHEVMVNLMANPTTEAGLRVAAALDPSPYETGKQVSDAALAHVN